MMRARSLPSYRVISPEGFLDFTRTGHGGRSGHGTHGAAGPARISRVRHPAAARGPRPSIHHDHHASEKGLFPHPRKRYFGSPSAIPPASSPSGATRPGSFWGCTPATSRPSTPWTGRTASLPRTGGGCTTAAGRSSWGWTASRTSTASATPWACPRPGGRATFF